MATTSLDIDDSMTGDQTLDHLDHAEDVAHMEYDSLNDEDVGQDLNDQDVRQHMQYNSEDDDNEPIDHYAFMAEIDQKDAALEQRHNNLLSQQVQRLDDSFPFQLKNATPPPFFFGRGVLFYFLTFV